MITLLYASRATGPMDPEALADLLSVARERNANENLTGVLLYAYESFLQQLEGEEEAVRRVFASISQDARHGDIRVLSQRSVTERRYGDWAMGFHHPDAASLAASLPGYRPSVHSPLVSSELVANAEIAEAVLALSVSGGRVQG